MYIPWDIAPMAAAEDGERTIGLHFTRFVADSSERYASAPIAKTRQRFLSEFASATIKDYTGASLQILGYATFRQDRVADEYSFTAGVDIFWKPNSNQQLSLSIKPDFGQVESDNLVVNFSPTETFFQRTGLSLPKIRRSLI